MRPLEMARELVKVLEEMENCKGTPCNNKTLLSEVPVGGVIKGNSTDYIVLEHFENGTTKVVSKNLMLKGIKFGDSSNYKGSNIERQIIDKCLPLFEQDFGKENLVYHDTELTSVDMQNEFGSFSSAVRPYTFDEARKYNDFLADENLENYTWTCTPWSTKKRGYLHSGAVVSPSGYFNRYDCSCYDFGVRPVCILKSNILVSKED